MGNKDVTSVTLHIVDEELDTMVLVLYRRSGGGARGDALDDPSSPGRGGAGKNNDNSATNSGATAAKMAPTTSLVAATVTSCAVTIELGPDGMFLRSSQLVAHRTNGCETPVWSGCTVVRGGRLWTVDIHSKLHVWSLDGFSTHVADVVLLDLCPSLSLDASSTMSVSSDSSVVVITSSSTSSSSSSSLF